ncbi:DUF1835 domain-containing protein [Actibacterium sp. 188UL27-1]|uniref:DUF1835 domain-containing protein n=1 Tax=Actibacterium sp. 188UL27-1 TaxID=2786961 RepID=UPI001959D008|nr:DUF1835 domain-containing protein [Actibacterium sp. 188UL27-1]
MFDVPSLPKSGRLILTQSNSVAGIIRQWFKTTGSDHDDMVIGCCDDYSHGPIHSTGTKGIFFKSRQTYWKTIQISNDGPDFIPGLSEEYQRLSRAVRQANAAEIWVANCVQDVFFAIVTVHLLVQERVDLTTLSIRLFHTNTDDRGLRFCHMEDLGGVYRASDLIPVGLPYFEHAWISISHRSVQKVEKWISTQDPGDFITKALRSFLLRFPYFNNGLGSIDRRLLAAGTTDMKKASYTVGTAMTYGEPQNDAIGDIVLFKRLVELGTKQPDPWFDLSGDTNHLRSCDTKLTDSGVAARTTYSIQPF